MRNQLRILTRKSLAGLKIGLIAFSLLTLLMAGASSAMRLNQPIEKNSEPTGLAAQVSLHPNPADISPDAENMNHGSPFNGEPAAILGQFLFTGGLTHDQAKARPVDQHGLSDFPHHLDRSHDRPIGTLGRVNSHRAHTLTLVGAKPDGTS